MYYFRKSEVGVTEYGIETAELRRGAESFVAAPIKQTPPICGGPHGPGNR